MKKYLLSIAAAVTCICASAFDVEPLANDNLFPGSYEPCSITEAVADPTPDTSGAQLRFCGNLYSATRLTSTANTSYRVYIHIPAEIADQLAGNKVTQITCAPALQANFSGFIFATDKLPSTVDGTYDSSTSVTFDPVSGNTISQQTFNLTNPYTIKAGQDFYFGYVTIDCGSKDYPVGFDSSEANSFSGDVDLFQNSNTTTVNIGDYRGNNTFLYAATGGDKTEIRDLAEFNECSVNYFQLPTVNIEDYPGIMVPICNLGTNNITEIGYISRNGDKVVSGTRKVSIGRMENVTYLFNLPALNEGLNEVEITFTHVNGTTPINIKRTAKAIGLHRGEAFERNFLVEEATGTWCGYCPAGIVGLETMYQNHPDNFIAIGVHASDEFSVSSYNPIFNLTGGGVPGSVINRDKFWDVYPSAYSLERAYTSWMQANPGAAKIEFGHCDFDGSKYKITTKTTFAFSQSNAKYGIALVVTEDGLYADQSNYYSGSSSAPGDWGQKPSVVNDWEYVDVARGIYDYDGLRGSVPTEIVKGKTYEFTGSVPKTNVTNLSNVSITALLLERTTGCVLNAARLRYADYDAGVEEITPDDADANLPAIYYNLQGQRIDTPAPGQIVIRRQGSKATKTLVR